jgi:N6-adenosine-specific RNA methylase IME4
MLDTCTISNLNCLLETSRMFGTIYADPPWKYDNTAARGSAGKHYGCMTVDEICALPIDRLAAPNSHLYLWTTDAFLPECAKIYRAWGFEFLGTFQWLKPTMGTGNYWRHAHETLEPGRDCRRPLFVSHAAMGMASRAA